ncbi:MAG: Protein archease [Methanonatronarchaeales archaeon]|nr:Protein archease [Methanonatronarchaeales archaeon]
MSYEFLEHTADVKFRATGGSLEELFESAAEALVASMVDPSTVRPEVEVEVEVEGDDLTELLFLWLDEVVFLVSARTMLFHKFEVEEVEHLDGAHRARCRGLGEEADLDRHSFETEVKAVSYHGMEVEETDGGWEASVILDV